jgi:hypothetical protein
MATNVQNIKMEPCEVFWGGLEGLDLGGTEGGIEISFETSTIEVKADQSGEQILDLIQSGTNITVSMTLLEGDAEKIKAMISDVSGDSYTPDEGTEVVGYGESKNFHNLSQYAKELVLRPMRLGAGNNSENFHFWKAIPNLESLSLSGTALKSFPITFTVIRDASKNAKINLFAFGDGTQEGLNAETEEGGEE